MSLRGRHNHTCASCDRFPRASLEDSGEAQCAIFERPATFSDTACVLYEAARDGSARKTLVIKLYDQKKQREENKE
jgi:hypothetical protein